MFVRNDTFEFICINLYYTRLVDIIIAVYHIAVSFKYRCIDSLQTEEFRRNT
jgi:hypothetical protein